MARFPMAGVDYCHPLTLPKMHLRAHGVWREAHRRGLVSDAEWQWYEQLIETHPFSWKGWLRNGPRRARPHDGGTR